MNLTIYRSRSIPCLIYGLGMLLAKPAFAAPAPAACTGILVCNPPATFSGYVAAIIHDDMGYVLLIAFIMIIYSGIQYMLSGTGSTDLQKKAKDRIFTILLGVALLLLSSVLVTQLLMK